MPVLSVSPSLWLASLLIKSALNFSLVKFQSLKLHIRMVATGYLKSLKNEPYALMEVSKFKYAYNFI